MKKSRIVLSVVFALAIVAAVFSKSSALQQDEAFVQDAGLCDQLPEKPVECSGGGNICVVAGQTIFAHTSVDGTQCMTAYHQPNP